LEVVNSPLKIAAIQRETATHLGGFDSETIDFIARHEMFVDLSALADKTKFIRFRTAFFKFDSTFWSELQTRGRYYESKDMTPTA
jgi:hypothetical protein